jgi:hypothetical protein
LDDKAKWKLKYKKLEDANTALRNEVRAMHKARLTRELALAREFQREFRKQLATLITAAFGFVAALFWNTAIKDAINAFVPPAQSWVGETFVAVLVTFIAVLAIWFVSRGTGEKRELPPQEPAKAGTIK